MKIKLRSDYLFMMALNTKNLLWWCCRGDWALFGLCYPPDTVFQVMSDIYDRQNNVFDGLEDYGPVSSLAELEKHRQDRKYFFDRDAG